MIALHITGTLVAIFVFLAISTRKRRRLPPGPTPLPLIGNLLHIPHSQEWLTWRSYIEHYGDIVYLKALGTNYLLLGSQEAITDLLEKRNHFNSRPYHTMLCDLMDHGWNLGFIPYGNLWRLGRKIIHSETNAIAAMVHRPVLLCGARQFICDLLAAESARPADKLSETSKNVLPHLIRRSFAFTAVRMIYGIKVRDPIAEARYVDVPEKVLHALNEGATPGRFLVDYIPILRYVPHWFPGAHFQRFARESTALCKQMRNDPMAFVKSQMALGSTSDSMAARMLISFPGDEQLVKDVAGVTYVGGSDTTVSAVTSYFLAMVTYPHVQQLVQEELDRVVGRERLPEFADKANLPYLEAVMRECLRWLPILPQGVAHVTEQDDEYRGYFIPKGTAVLPFQWGLLQDAKNFPQPSVFSPERYLNFRSDNTWELRTDVVDPRTYAFGFGRRVCPGRHIAEQSLFATLSTVAHTLKVMRANDSFGHEVVPDARMSSGFICHPIPFAYELQMREDAEHLVKLCAEAAER